MSKQKYKYWVVPIHVDATGHICVKVPADWTQKQIQEFAMDEFWPGFDNTEIGDPVNALKPSKISAEHFDKERSKGQTAEHTNK